MKQHFNLRLSLLFVALLFNGCSHSSSGPRTTSATETVRGQFIGPAQLVDAGNTTPEAALETGFWAEASGNYAAVMAGYDPQTRADAKGWYGDKNTFSARAKNKFAAFKGLQILARKLVASDKVELKYHFQFGNEGMTKIAIFVRINGAWKEDHTTSYESGWDDGSQPEPQS